MTFERHRRESRTQIMIPLILGIIIILAVAVFSTFGGSDTLSQWGDISLIWLILPMLFVGLFGLALLVGLIYLLIRILRAVPVYTRRLQNLFVTLSYQVNRISNNLVAPIIRAKSTAAGARQLRRQLGGRSRGG